MSAPRDRPRTKPKAVYEDSRKVVAAEVVEEAITSAAEHVEKLKHERLDTPESYAKMRQYFSCLPDAERRAVLVRLLIDEAGRVDHDRGAAWNRTARHEDHSSARAHQ